MVREVKNLKHLSSKNCYHLHTINSSISEIGYYLKVHRTLQGVDSNPDYGIGKFKASNFIFQCPFVFLSFFKVDQTHSIFSECQGPVRQFQRMVASAFLSKDLS